jgi:hypothetical protein
MKLTKVLTVLLTLALCVACALESGVMVALTLYNDSAQSAVFTVSEVDGDSSYNVSPFGSLTVDANVDDPSAIPVRVSVGGQTFSELYNAGFEGGSATVALIEAGAGNFSLGGDLYKPPPPSSNTPTMSQDVSDIINLCLGMSECPNEDGLCTMACGVIEEVCLCLGEDEKEVNDGTVACVTAMAPMLSTLSDICSSIPAGSCSYCNL